MPNDTYLLSDLRRLATFIRGGRTSSFLSEKGGLAYCPQRLRKGAEGEQQSGGRESILLHVEDPC